MHIVELNGTWDLIERPLTDDVAAYGAVAGAPATCAVCVPGDVNDAITRSGRLPEPLVGLNFQQYSNWVPERAWWYRRTFVTPAETPLECVELSLDGLDVHADVWLNGIHLGHHATAFMPFRVDVTAHLRRDGDNLLIVRLTTGRERVADRAGWPLLKAVPTEAQRGYPGRGMPERVFLRKPAFTWGWDWSPALPTCGITGRCELRCHARTEIDDVALSATLTRGAAQVRIGVELQRRTLTGTAWGSVTVRLTDEAGGIHTCEATDVLLRSGLTQLELTLDIRKPRLWWPNGAGPQHRYTVEAWLTCEDQTVAIAPFQWGLRTIALEVKPGLFRFHVNGVPLFIQGGNWVPCDHLYGRTTPARLEHLVAEAATAHFNCLRIWGGGRYELDDFYEACDRHGILLWHDFMSACAPLPYHEPWFADACRAEAGFQVRRLRNRACLLLWCGNNEVSGCYEWFAKEFAQMRDPAWPLYFQDLPRIVAAESAHVPYWPTSPYGGAKSVSDLAVGDDHHWVVMRPDKQFWSHPEYWDGAAISIFNSEYGYGGPCCIESTREYLGVAQPDLFSAVGREHTNTFYDIPRVNFSIDEHYAAGPNLPIGEYIRLGGLCQGLNLGYSLESLRANTQTWGGIFWMYNDAWGENGWTIIDHALRRKISYYNVRRSLAPQRLVLRRGGQAFGGDAGDVLLIALNDTGRPLRTRVTWGFYAYDGATRDTETIHVDVPAHRHAIVARRPAPPADALQRGTLAAQAASHALDPVVWRHGRYRDTALPPARVRITRQRADGADLVLRVVTDSFAHAVHFDLSGDWRLSDCWFDLLAGEAREVRVEGGACLAGTAIAATCINAAANGPAATDPASPVRG